MFRLLLRFRVCFTVVATCGLYDVFGNRPTDSFHVFSSLWNLGMYGKGFGVAATMGRHIGCATAEFANFETKFEDHFVEAAKNYESNCIPRTFLLIPNWQAVGFS